MSSLPKPRYTPEEYLAIEREAEYKSEYFSGEIFAMAGATEAHILITTNVVIALGGQLRGRPCKTYSTDMRVQVSATGLYTYPDVIVVCGEARFLDERRDTLLNPTLVIEVLSPSTEAYDRGEKFAHYRRLDSLTDYVMIAQDKPCVEHYARQQTGQWLLTAWNSLPDVAALPSIGCQLVLADVYDRVEFAAAEVI